MFDRFEGGLLTPAETASYLGIPHAVLCSWLKTRAAGAALVHQVEPACEGRPSVPFVAVAEAHVLRSLRFLGLRLSEVTDAAAALRHEFGTPYALVSKRIVTDGLDFFVEHGLGGLRRRSLQRRDAARATLHDQLHHLTWGPDDCFPSSLRLWQYPESVPVMIDPRFGRGRPVVAANRVAVDTITDLWEAGEAVEDIAYDFGMTNDEVQALCRAVARLGT